ncbi:MAG: cupin domain-containing protein, partial [Candidatus Edwardsbacteria bacterium]|nr:cupin domain-containing protein [Candidatus Edwardsbacteria bacterium]
TDHRGWLVEIIKNEDLLPGRKEFGQFFLTTAHPGVSKGHHYHLRKNEWFCVIKGRGLLALESIDDVSRREIVMDGDEPSLIRIPLRTAHAIKNTGSEMLYLLCYTDEPFDPADPDTNAYNVQI